jgi:hypothetical protein
MSTIRRERLQIMLTLAELSVIDDFRFENRLPTRAAAVRELLQRGLASAAKRKVRDGSRSRDFGALGVKNGSGFKSGDGG